MEGLQINMRFCSSVFVRSSAIEKFSVDDDIRYLLVNRFPMAVETRTCT